MVKAQPGQCPSWAPVPFWGAPGGSGRLDTSRGRERAFDTSGEVDPTALRVSPRRPSVPGDTEALPRLVQAELKVAHEGWLTKQSKTGLPNWNRRWLILPLTLTLTLTLILALTLTLTLTLTLAPTPTLTLTLTLTLPEVVHPDRRHALLLKV